MRIFVYFAREYPGQTLVVLACLLLAGALEGIGYTTLLPLLSLVTREGGGPDAQEMSWLERSGRDALAAFELEPTLPLLLGILAGAFWLKAGAVLPAKRQVGYTVAQVATDLRLALLRALMAARWSHYTRLPGGGAANALATEADRSSLAYHHAAQVASFGLELVLYLGLALAISWQVTLGAAATALLMFASLGALVRMAGRAGRKQTKFLKSLLSRVTDSLQAVKLLKATGREPLIGPLLERDTERLNRALRRRVFSKEALRALQEPILVACACIALFVLHGVVGLQFPETAVLVALFVRTIGSSNQMQRKFQVLAMEASALESLRGMIERARADAEVVPRGAAPTLRRGVALEDVHVRFDGAEILRGFSMEIPAGRITALVGDSGSGKTTATDLVTGLVRPDAGTVRVDGVPLGELDLRRWRQMIGYVPQELLMLHDSVERNVSLGDPEISREDVERALRNTGAWEFVSAMPAGLDSSVGERGALLSGGQRQRIALARALVHGAQLLILDEATAALDRESEAAVWSAVARLRGRATVLAISHQPALSGVADRVYRIEQGRARLVAGEGEERRAAV